MLMKSHQMRASRGFTLIEVMIALVVTATGLLGVAKIQAAAIANTKISGSRALIALQTGSLVSAMHANPLFWASNAAPQNWTVSNYAAPSARVLSADVSALADCKMTCKPDELAAADVQVWAKNMKAHFPTYEAKVDCTSSSATTQPVSCTLFVSWKENSIATNKATASVSQALASFSVHLQP